MLEKKELKHLALLARIELNDQELDKYARELGSIIEYVEKLKDLDTQNVKPTSHVMSVEDVFREDLPAASLDVEEVLRNAPRRKGNFFVVPKIIEDKE